MVINSRNLIIRIIRIDLAGRSCCGSMIGIWEIILPLRNDWRLCNLFTIKWVWIKYLRVTFSSLTYREMSKWAFMADLCCVTSEGFFVAIDPINTSCFKKFCKNKFKLFVNYLKNVNFSPTSRVNHEVDSFPLPTHLAQRLKRLFFARQTWSEFNIFGILF